MHNWLNLNHATADLFVTGLIAYSRVGSLSLQGVQILVSATAYRVPSFHPNPERAFGSLSSKIRCQQESAFYSEFRECRASFQAVYRHQKPGEAHINRLLIEDMTGVQKLQLERRNCVVAAAAVA